MSNTVIVTWKEVKESNIQILKKLENYVYLHTDPKGNPFYCGNSSKGQRYSGSYHWILGCLESGRKLYVAKFEEKDLERFGKSRKPNQTPNFKYLLLGRFEMEIIQKFKCPANKTTSRNYERYGENEEFTIDMACHRGDVPNIFRSVSNLGSEVGQE